MKKIILLSLVLGLGGCAATTDMMNNQYMSVIPTSTDLNGYWSGNNGPYAVTYSFNKDGTGLMCSSWNGKDSIEKLKVNGNEIIVQSGLKQTIKSKTDSKLELKVNYYDGGSYQYSPDPNLQNASPYCEKALRN
ncbi:J517_1871 family lipoprotein [Acinetobacter baumannii]|uniref:J517_1871 family lipoprotein n=1 Tax=Acinetobacter baumannii TaxID=470 RepID=UPI00390647A0